MSINLVPSITKHFRISKLMVKRYKHYLMSKTWTAKILLNHSETTTILVHQQFVQIMTPHTDQYAAGDQLEWLGHLRRKVSQLSEVPVYKNEEFVQSNKNEEFDNIKF